MSKISKFRLVGFGFLLVSAVIILMLVFVPNFFPKTIPSFGLTIVGISSILFCLLSIPSLDSLIKHIRLWLGEDENHEKRIHLDFDTPIPEHMLNLANSIENLGLKKLGVKALVRDDNSLYCHWLWKDDTNTVLAFLVAHINRPYVYFMTTYEDGFELETAYNFQIQVNQRNVMINNVDTSVNEAYHLHMHLYDEQQMIHGLARIFTSLNSTDPISEEHKRNMRDIYFSQLVKLTVLSFFYITFVLALISVILIAPYNTGIAFFTFFLIVGLSLSLIDYDSVFKTSVDGRKSRKVVEESA